MIFWELLTLSKPYYKCSKEQHMLFVCEGGERPPLESPVDFSSWLPSPSSFHSSLSSLQSISTLGEDSVDYDQVMTEPIKELLRNSWEQVVSRRFTMKQAYDTLQRIIDPTLIVSEDNKVDEKLSSDSTMSKYNFDIPTGCMPSVSNLLMDSALYLRELSLAACFGHDCKSSQSSYTNSTNNVSTHELINSVPSATSALQKNEKSGIFATETAPPNKENTDHVSNEKCHQNTDLAKPTTRLAIQ
jgi:hypothetical protein